MLLLVFGALNRPGRVFASGTLSETISSSPSFSGSLDGTDKTLTAQLGVTVSDKTGSGAGWNLTIGSSQFTTGTFSLSTTALSVTAATSACLHGNSCTLPINSVSYPLTVPITPSASKVYNAAANTGTGNGVAITLTLALQLPANIHAGSYTSTITLAVASGP